MSYHIITPDESEGNAGRHTASGYLKCAVCKYGVLENKKLYRLSGPAVVIGYILLIPSILGMLGCAVVFFGVITFNNPQSTAASERGVTSQDVFDQNFRRSCATGFSQYYQSQDPVADSPPVRVIADYCECALSAYKDTGSASTARQICTQKYSDGTLTASDAEVQNLYVAAMNGTEKQEPEPNAGSHFVSVLAGGLALWLGVAFFVAGLLGWLLVMKKRVLQCSVCGAIISAS